MTGDEGEFWKDVKDSRRKHRNRVGIECPGCKIQRPKACPTILVPGKRCKVCGTTYEQAKTGGRA